jgi:hypothetical protein
MIATALLGGVLGARGDALVSGFHTAVMACAVACAAAGMGAFLLVRDQPRA